MNRNDALALGASAVIIGLAASTHRSPSGSKTLGEIDIFPTPPSTTRRGFAARDATIVRSAPSPTAPEVARLGRGSAVRVAAEEDVPGSGFLPIVREWVEAGARRRTIIGYIAALDVVYNDPGPRPTLGTPANTRALGAVGIASEGRADRSDGGECDVFGTLTWPSSVDHFKERLDTVFQATNRSIELCATFPDADRQQWALFYGRWQAFQRTPTPTFGSGGHWDQTCAYARTLDGWRDRLRQTRCELVGPSNIHGYELPPGVGGGLESLATIVKWGALTIGGAVLLATFYPEIRAGLGALRATRRR